jgi:hypothetical protein
MGRANESSPGGSQGGKTHAAASRQSMGQWRGARQAAQPPHTLGYRLQATGHRATAWGAAGRPAAGETRLKAAGPSSGLVFFSPPHIPCDTVSRSGTPRPVPPHGFSAPHPILAAKPKRQGARHQTHFEFRTHIMRSAWQKRGLGQKKIDLRGLGQNLPAYDLG